MTSAIQSVCLSVGMEGVYVYKRLYTIQCILAREYAHISNMTKRQFKFIHHTNINSRSEGPMPIAIAIADLSTAAVVTATRSNLSVHDASQPNL